MSTLYDKLANAVALYNTTISNALANDGSPAYQITFNIGPSYSNPNSIEVLDDGLVIEQPPGAFSYYSLPVPFIFDNQLIGNGASVP